MPPGSGAAKVNIYNEDNLVGIPLEMGGNVMDGCINPLK